jgi:PKD repeat protein
MQRFLLLWLISLSSLPILSFSQSSSQIRKAEKIFKNKGEIHFWFLLKSKADKKELTRVISIDHMHGDTVWAFANKRGLLRFYELGYSKINQIESPAEVFRKTQKKKRKGQTSVSAFDNYPTYGQYEQIMLQFQTTYPNICKLVNLGTLPSGRKILALKISDSLSKRENEPQFLYTSTMHGDETAGYPLMLKLADLLLSSYGSNPRLTYLVNQTEIWINPLANPDGTYRGGNNSVAGASRFNISNVDLNRNYPDPEDGPHPDGEAYQPETKIFMAFADSMEFVMSANFHGGAEVANFPWDTWQKRSADETWWTAESLKFVDSARVSAPPNYFNQIFGYPNLPGVVQGFDWYEINGGRQDYMNWFKNCKEFTVELSDTKILPENQIDLHWNYLTKSLLNYMEACLRGFRGTVKDACTGKPIRAKIAVLNYDKDSSHIYSGKVLGNYHRPISPDFYNIQVSAPGYQTITFNNLFVSPGLATVKDFFMVPEIPKPNFKINKNALCGTSAQFSDLSGSGNRWLWDFGDGDTSNLQNPLKIYLNQGNYDVKLKVWNCAGYDSVTVQNAIQIISPKIVSSVGDTSNCGAIPHTLKATSPNKIFWYSSLNSNVALDSGLVFQTDSLKTSTTFYVQASTAINFPKLGPGSNLIGQGGFYTSNSYHYLIFDATSPFLLKSVKVFANTAGNRTIQFRNAQGVAIFSRVFNIPQGESRINLNWSIPVGTGLQLGINGGNSNNLFRNSSGANYPYNIEGVVSITGNSAGNPAFYYYFYDWEVSAKCESVRLPVIATVNNAPSPLVSITSGITSVCEGDSVLLTANISNALNPTISWFSGINPVGNSNPIYLKPSTGNNSFRCRIFSSDSCAVNNPANSSLLTIGLKPKPGIPQIQILNGFLVSNSGPVKWYRNEVLVSNQPSDSLLPIESGTYYAVSVGPNGCASESSNSIVLTSNSNQKVKSLSHMFYSESELHVENLSNSVKTIEIFNISGQLLLAQKVNQGSIRIPCKLMSPGKYFVKLEGEKTNFSFLKN